jgi:hypothetical protein
MEEMMRAIVVLVAVVFAACAGRQRPPGRINGSTGDLASAGSADAHHLRDGKISEEWAGEDFTAFLNDTGTYKAPWIR